MRGGVGGALRRGDRRAERGDAAGRDRGRAHDRDPARRAPRRPDPGRRPRAHRSGQVEGEARRTIDQGGAYVNNVRQTDAGRTLGPADLLHDRYLVLRKGRREVHIVTGHMRRRFLRAPSVVLMVGCRLHPHVVCGRGPAGRRRAPHVGLGQRDQPRGGHRHADRRQRAGAQGRAQRHGRRARGLRHHAQRRRDGQRRAAVARPRRERTARQAPTTLEGTAANECYDAGATNKKLLAESAAQRHQGRGALQRGRSSASARSTAAPCPTTTTTDNSSGGIFG